MTRALSLWQVGAGAELRALDGVATYTEFEDRVELGTYTGMRACEGRRVLSLDLHLLRLRESSARLGLDCLSEGALRKALASVAFELAPRDHFVRIDLLPSVPESIGASTGVIIGASPIAAPSSEALELGIGVGWADGMSRETPEVKDGAWLLARRPFPLRTLEANDHLLVDSNDCVLEGTSSNFFAVRDGQVLTSADGVLNGVTRRAALRVLDSLGIDVRFERVARDEIMQLDEAFLTSATRPILPVTRVAGERLGSGRCGELTRGLIDGHSALLQSEADDLVDC